MRPGVLHVGRQRHRGALRQRRGFDIDVVVREYGTDARIERGSARSSLSKRRARRNGSGCEQRHESPTIDHGPSLVFELFCRLSAEYTSLVDRGSRSLDDGPLGDDGGGKEYCTFFHVVFK